MSVLMASSHILVFTCYVIGVFFWIFAVVAVADWFIRSF